MFEDQGGSDDENTPVTKVCEVTSDGSADIERYIDINTPRDAKDYKSIYVKNGVEYRWLRNPDNPDKNDAQEEIKDSSQFTKRSVADALKDF